MRHRLRQAGSARRSGRSGRGQCRAGRAAASGSSCGTGAGSAPAPDCKCIRTSVAEWPPERKERLRLEDVYNEGKSAVESVSH